MTAEYFVATGLVGFGTEHTSLRVRVEEWYQHDVRVITADLRDAGTRLILRRDQLTSPESFTMQIGRG